MNNDKHRLLYTMPCPFCGGTIPTQVKKCKHCGEWIKGNPNDKKIRELIIGGIVIMTVLIVSALLILYFNPDISNLWNWKN
jgi:predicted nucleic acid-binding Zn ribbon protein